MNIMDDWQKYLYMKLRDFVGKVPETVIGEEVQIKINRKEAYVLMKALEDQQRHLNPLMKIPETPSPAPTGVPERPEV